MAKYANQFVPDGLKTKVKKAFVKAFREALTDSFWSNIDDSMEDLDPAKQVLEEFPVVKTEWPFARVAIRFTSTNWMNVSRYFLQKENQLAQTAEADVNVMLDIFAMSSKQRDRMEDAYLNALLFGYTRPSSSGFYSQLSSYDDMSLQPILNTIDISQDSYTKSIPWCRDSVVYQGTLSFKAKVSFAFNQGEWLPFLKQVNVAAESI